MIDKSDHVQVHVHVHLPADDGVKIALLELKTLLNQMINTGATTMATLDEFIFQQTDFNAALNTALTDIGGDIQSLNDQITALIAAPGTLTPEQIAAIQALALSGAALNAKAAALNDLTPPVVPPVV